MSLHPGDGSPAALDGYSTESTIVGKVTTPPAYALDGSSSTLPSTNEDRTKNSESLPYPQEATIIITPVTEETLTTDHSDNASQDVTPPHPSSQDATPTGTTPQIDNEMQTVPNSSGLQEATPQSSDANADITTLQEVTSNKTLSLVTSHDLAISTE